MTPGGRGEWFYSFMIWLGEFGNFLEDMLGSSSRGG